MVPFDFMDSWWFIIAMAILLAVLIFVYLKIRNKGDDDD